MHRDVRYRSDAELYRSCDLSVCDVERFTEVPQPADPRRDPEPDAMGG